MAAIHDYAFHKMSRMGEDSCDISQRNLQNSKHATYMLDNFRPACPMKTAIDFATSQPNVNYKGGHQVGINGCNIDDNSHLSIAKLSRPKCRISLFHRPFATVPFLGRGESNPVLESKMQQSDLADNRKSNNPSSEISYMEYKNTPMLPSLERSITDPRHFIEDAASAGWIRGGLPSRELARDKEYAQHNSI